MYFCDVYNTSSFVCKVSLSPPFIVVYLKKLLTSITLSFPEIINPLSNHPSHLLQAYREICSAAILCALSPKKGAKWLETVLKKCVQLVPSSLAWYFQKLGAMWAHENNKLKETVQDSSGRRIVKKVIKSNMLILNISPIIDWDDMFLAPAPQIQIGGRKLAESFVFCLCTFVHPSIYWI